MVGGNLRTHFHTVTGSLLTISLPQSETTTSLKGRGSRRMRCLIRGYSPPLSCRHRQPPLVLVCQPTDVSVRPWLCVQAPSLTSVCHNALSPNSTSHTLATAQTLPACAPSAPSSPFAMVRRTGCEALQAHAFMPLLCLRYQRRCPVRLCMQAPRRTPVPASPTAAA